MRVTQIAGVRQTGSRVHSFSQDSTGFATAFSRDGTLLARIAGKRVDIWRTTGELVRSLEFDGYLWGLPSFSPDGSRILLAINAPDNLRSEVWDISSGTKVLTLRASGNTDVPANAKNEMWWSEYSPDGSRIAMATKFSLSLWDANTGVMIDSLLDVSNNRLSYSRSGRYLFTDGSSIKVRDPLTGAVLKTIKSNLWITDLSYDGEFLLAAPTSPRGNKDSLFLVDVEKGTVTPVWGWNDRVGTPFGLFRKGQSSILIGRQLDDEVIAVSEPTSRHVIAHLNQFPGPVRTLTSHPDGNLVLSQSGAARNLELWSINPFDISDSNFTIESSRQVLPAAMLDGVKVGTSADSTLRAYLRNSGSSPMDVQGIVLVSGDVADFSILEGAGSFTLAPGEGRDLRIRFQPTSKGNRSAWLEIRTAGDTIVGELRGEGLRGTMLPLQHEINFGDVLINQPRELWVRTYKNTGTAPLRIDSLFTAGMHPGTYSVVGSVSTPFTIPPGDTHAVTLLCSVKVAEPFSSDYLVYLDEYGERYELQLKSNGVYQLGVDDDAVIAGRFGLLREILPNPVSTYLRVACNGRAGEHLAIEVVDLVGMVVHAERYTCAETGRFDITVDVQSVPSGTYIVRATGNGRHEARTIVVRR